MANGDAPLYSFNRGIISRLALARTDLKRTALSAETMRNWMPRSLGSMMLRPGLQYIAGSALADQTVVHIPFVFSTDDTALVEIYGTGSSSHMRVLVSEAVITRASVATAITNGTFDTDLTGWTSADETGAVSAWATGGFMGLIGTAFNAAIRKQAVNPGADANTEHAVKVVIARGPVTLRIGSSDGGDEYVHEVDLGTGSFEFAFTPTGTFYVQLQAHRLYQALVDSVSIAAAGAMVVDLPYAAADLSKIRWDQSGDVLFLACPGYQQRRIERHATRSWGIAIYQPEAGPFRLRNTGSVKLSVSAITGDITVTASKPFFRSTHGQDSSAKANQGALFKISSVGQTVTATLAGDDQYTDPIKVTGIGPARKFVVTIDGDWSGHLELQRSVSEPGAWIKFKRYKSGGDVIVDEVSDLLDNQVIYYRVGFVAGDYASGSADVQLEFAGGSIDGTIQITEVLSSTSATAIVYESLGSLDATDFWYEGEWSDARSWPSSVAFYEGRLWWAGGDKVNGSVSDAFDDFDDATTGDSGPINRSIGSGPVDTINWLLPLQRLVAGGEGAEHSIRSTSFDEPVTPSNFNIKAGSTQGSAEVGAVKVDSRGIFVQKSGRRIFSLEYDFGRNDYASTDLTIIVPDIAIAAGGIVQIAVQRQPDTRVHCVLADGTVAVLVYDPAEDLQCWVKVDSPGAGGKIKEAVVLPGDVEDKVYYQVQRTVGGTVYRYLERWAREDECQGGTTCKLADAHVAATSSIGIFSLGGLSHLEGKQVVVWADGKDLGTFTVSGGSINFSDAVYEVVAGLAYDAQFKSAKLAYAAQLGTALTMRKRVAHLGLVLADTHYQGLQFGPSFDVLDNLPLVEAGRITPADTVWDAFDSDTIEFPGAWSTDERICLKAAAPRPVTVLAAVVDLQTSEKR